MRSANPLQTIGQGLVVIAVLLGVIAAALWLRPDFGSPTESTAHAAYGVAENDGPGLPATGRQRLMMVAELKHLNAQVKSLSDRLDAFDKALRAGDYRVQTLEPRTAKEGDR